MSRRGVAMLWLAIVIVSLIVLTACANDGQVHKECIEGVDCLVRRDRINGRVIAMTCDWDN